MFDVVVANPPYQILKPGNKKSMAIWQKFVLGAIDVCSEGGYVCMVHPPGWREPKGNSKKVQKAMLSRQLLYLSMHGLPDGKKTFGITTAYDWYVLHNVAPTKLTTIRTRDGEVGDHDLRGAEFIPNAFIGEISRLVAKPGEEAVTMVGPTYGYGTLYEHVSSERDDIFVHPVIYICYAAGGLILKWSNTNERGHFGVSKVLWSNGTSSVHTDPEGKYGLTQFAYAIADEPANLESIKQAMTSDKFVKMMKACRLNGNHKYNHRFIELFRKDFWKEFV